MPNTPILQLPYPSLDDTANVPRDMQALATKLDGLPGVLPPTPVTSLPSSPTDGQEVYYIVSDPTSVGSTPNIVWHLRYRAANLTDYKWEFVGGAPMASFVPEGVGPFPGDLWCDSTAPGGPVVTIPLRGTFVISHGAQVSPFQAPDTTVMAGLLCTCHTLFETPGAIPDQTGYNGTVGPVAAYNWVGQSSRRVTYAAVGGSLRQMYYNAVYGARYVNRWLTVQPVNVG